MRFRETNGSRPRPVRPRVHPTNTLRDCTAPCELIAPRPWLPPRPHIANLCDVASQCFPSRGLFLYPLNLGWPRDQDWARVKTNKMSRAQNLGRR